jgi:hypothetical protein
MARDSESITPGDIAGASKCFCLTGTDFEAAVIYLLEKIYENGGGSPLTKDQIQNLSKCFCLTGIDYERAVLFLLTQIMENTTPN